jgi:hypothetical protein
MRTIDTYPPYTVRIPGHASWAEGFGSLVDALNERDHANRAIGHGHVVIDDRFNVIDDIDDDGNAQADEVTA